MGCASKILKGCAGLAKAALSVDRADNDTVQARRDICRACPHAGRNPDPKYEANGGLTTFSKCDRCGCFIAAKTVIAREACPLAKWPAEAEEQKPDSAG